MKLSSGAVKAFSYILTNQPVQRSQIAQAMHIGVASLGKYVYELMDKRYIREIGVSESTGGRKPWLYCVDTEYYRILCINISTIYCEVAIANLALDLLVMERFPIASDEDPGDVVSKIADLFRTLKGRLGIDDSCFLGGGVTLFSEPMNDSGVMYRPIIQYMSDRWEGFPVMDRLRERINMPLFPQKGIKAIAALEYYFSRNPHVKTAAFILCATNLRSALVVDGQVQGTSPFFEDAFGHMVINFDGPRCKCGKRGCLNCYSSIPVIRREYSSLAGLDDVDISTVCEAAERGDANAVSVIADAATKLGMALANYINLFSPERVTLLSTLIEKSDLYYDIAVKVATEQLRYLGGTAPEFRREGTFDHPLTAGAGATAIIKLFIGS